MAKGINKVILVGSVGSDIEAKFMPSGGAVVNFCLATNDSWKDKSSGEKVEKTEWHRLVAFNRLAEIIGEYVKKGSTLYCEGALRTRKWTDNSGVEKYTTEIVLSELQMLGSREGGGSGKQSQRASAQPQSGQDKGGFDDFDDSLPF